MMHIVENGRKTVERLYQLFNNCPLPSQREPKGGWSVKEILGHLVDSARNNHERILRYVPKDNLCFPPYPQEEFVRRARYDSFDYRSLLTLWYLYNQLLLHGMAAIPDEDLFSTITMGDKPAVSLREMMDYYFVHMEKHERQVYRILQRVSCEK